MEWKRHDPVINNSTSYRERPKFKLGDRLFRLQFSQASAKTIPEIRLRLFPTTSFRIYYSLITLHWGAGIALSVQRLATGWTTEGSDFESRWGQEFSLLHVVQTGSGVHATSSLMGTGGSFPGVKWPGREADHSPAGSAEVKKMWIYTSTPPYAFMA
jgi:hypothetical protein